MMEYGVVFRKDGERLVKTTFAQNENEAIEKAIESMKEFNLVDVSVEDVRNVYMT